MDDLALMHDMTDQQRLLYTTTIAPKRRNRSIALVLCLLLGGLGAHHFYLGENGRGLRYALLCWTFIPAILAVFQLFTVMRRTDAYNARVATETAAAIRGLTPAPAR